MPSENEIHARDINTPGTELQSPDARPAEYRRPLAGRTASVFVLALVIACIPAIHSVAEPNGDGSSERDFALRINAERRHRDIARLVWSEELAQVARRHSQRMADQENLHHNPNLREDVDNWDVVGENVGEGPSVEYLHQAFMDSESHAANILAPEYTQLGVGVIVKDGTLWVTQIFRKPRYESSEPRPEASPSHSPHDQQHATAPQPSPEPESDANDSAGAAAPSDTAESSTQSTEAGRADPVEPRETAPEAPVVIEAHAAELTERMITWLLVDQEPAKLAIHTTVGDPGTALRWWLPLWPVVTDD